MVSHSKFRYLLIVPVLLLLMGLTLHPVQATEIPGDGMVSAGEVIDDDVILNAENPQMLGTVNGMLIILGNHALIDGTVNGDVIASGNYVEIGKNAHITGNVFSGAYLIQLKGQVDGSIAGGSNTLVLDEGSQIQRNLYYGGFSLEQMSGAEIGRDAFVGVYQTLLSGSIGRDLKLGAGAAHLTGNVGRNATLEVASPETSEPVPFFMFPMANQNQALPPEARRLIPAQQNPGLQIDESAQIGGKLTYTSPSPQTEQIQITPPQGTVYQTPMPDPDAEPQQPQPIVFRHAERGTAAFIAGMVLTWLWRVTKAFLTLVLIALLIFWLLPKKFDQSLQTLREFPAKSFGVGILVLVGGFVLLFFALLVLVSFTAFLAVITFGTLGFYFFLIGFSCYFLAFALFLLLGFVVSKILVAYYVGDWLMKSLSKSPVEGRALPLILGLVLYILLGYIPFLGFLIRFIMTLFGSGAIYLTLQSWWRERNSISQSAQA